MSRQIICSLLLFFCWKSVLSVNFATIVCKSGLPLAELVHKYKSIGGEMHLTIQMHSGIKRTMSINTFIHKPGLVCHLRNIFTNNLLLLSMYFDRDSFWDYECSLQADLKPYLSLVKGSLPLKNIMNLFELTFEATWANYSLFKAIDGRFQGSRDSECWLNPLKMLGSPQTQPRPRNLLRKAEIFSEAPTAPISPDLICAPIPFPTLPLFAAADHFMQCSL